MFCLVGDAGGSAVEQRWLMPAFDFLDRFAFPLIGLPENCRRLTAQFVVRSARLFHRDYHRQNKYLRKHMGLREMHRCQKKRDCRQTPPPRLPAPPPKHFGRRNRPPRKPPAPKPPPRETTTGRFLRGNRPHPEVAATAAKSTTTTASGRPPVYGAKGHECNARVEVMICFCFHVSQSLGPDSKFNASVGFCVGYLRVSGGSSP